MPPSPSTSPRPSSASRRSSSGSSRNQRAGIALGMGLALSQPTASTSSSYQPSTTASSSASDNGLRLRAQRQAQNLQTFIGGQQASFQEEDPSSEGEVDYSTLPDNQPSPLDAMYQGFSPYKNTSQEQEQASSEDEQSGAEAIKARNRTFQEQQRAGMATRDQFISPQAETGDDSFDSQDQTTVETAGGLNMRVVSPEADYRRLQTTERIRALQQAANQNQQEAERANAAQSAAQGMAYAGGGSELIETFHRGRRILTAGTGIGLFLAIAETDLIALNRGLFRGSIKVLPGSRPEGAYEANPNLRKSDFVDVGLAFGIHLAGIVGMFMMFIEALPIIIPIAIAVLGAAVLGNELAGILGNLAL